MSCTRSSCHHVPPPTSHRTSSLPAPPCRLVALLLVVRATTSSAPATAAAPRAVSRPADRRGVCVCPALSAHPITYLRPPLTAPPPSPRQVGCSRCRSCDDVVRICQCCRPQDAGSAGRLPRCVGVSRTLCLSHHLPPPTSLHASFLPAVGWSTVSRSRRRTTTSSVLPRHAARRTAGRPPPGAGRGVFAVLHAVPTPSPTSPLIPYPQPLTVCQLHFLYVPSSQARPSTRSSYCTLLTSRASSVVADPARWLQDTRVSCTSALHAGRRHRLEFGLPPPRFGMAAAGSSARIAIPSSYKRRRHSSRCVTCADNVVLRPSCTVCPVQVSAPPYKTGDPNRPRHSRINTYAGTLPWAGPCATHDMCCHR